MFARSIRQQRSLRPRRCCQQVEQLYTAGADYVSVSRLSEATELIEVINASEDGLLDELRAKAEPRLRDRREVLP